MSEKNLSSLGFLSDILDSGISKLNKTDNISRGTAG
jgi:hypothetical protein